ncbi:hypothetical protein WP1_158 [Pseudomonas phage WP1]
MECAKSAMLLWPGSIELEKKLGESEKRGSELAASYCDGVVGDEYGHAYCRYKAERDALAQPSPAQAEAERPTYECTMGVGDGDGKLLVHRRQCQHQGRPEDRPGARCCSGQGR